MMKKEYLDKFLMLDKRNSFLLFSLNQNFRNFAVIDRELTRHSA